jgi:hypothetical protein
MAKRCSRGSHFSSIYCLISRAPSSVVITSIDLLTLSTYFSLPRRGDTRRNQGGGHRHRRISRPNGELPSASCCSALFVILINSWRGAETNWIPIYVTLACPHRSAGERADAAVGEGEPEPHRPGAHHLHGRGPGLLRRRGQEDPVAGQAALVRGGARPPQEHVVPGRRQAAPGFLQAVRCDDLHLSLSVRSARRTSSSSIHIICVSR